MINGKRFTTHLASCTELAKLAKLAKRYPAALADSNSTYVVDGQTWTSAGVTTGIDMCLETYLTAALSLKEPATQTGYSGAAQLSKAFHRRFGMTPTLFRKLHAEPNRVDNNSANSQQLACDSPLSTQ